MPSTFSKPSKPFAGVCNAEGFGVFCGSRLFCVLAGVSRELAGRLLSGVAAETWGMAEAALTVATFSGEPALGVAVFSLLSSFSFSSFKNLSCCATLQLLLNVLIYIFHVFNYFIIFVKVYQKSCLIKYESDCDCLNKTR